MILDLNNHTLRCMTILVNKDDRIVNGRVESCVIRVVGDGVDLSQVMPGGRHNCSVQYYVGSVNDVLAHADGSKSIAEIAKLLGLQHGAVRSILNEHCKDYDHKRAVFKAMQTLTLDTAIYNASKTDGVLQACTKHGVNPTTYRARVRKYKELGLWKV